MRAIGRRINNPSHFLNSTTPFSLQSASSFCSGSGHGRGRGRGLPPTPFQFNTTEPPPPPPGQPDTESKPDPPPTGLGHGRGRILPAFSSFISSVKGGAGRGQSVPEPDHPSQPTESTQPSEPKLPSSIRSVLAGADRGQSVPEPDHPSQPTESTQPREPKLSSSISSVLAGAGRGKPGAKQPLPEPVSTPPIKEEENRHTRARARPRPEREARPESEPARPKMSREEAVKHAVRILSQGDDGRGGRGLGRGRGRGGGRGFGRGHMEGKEASDLYLGDNADGEKLANKLGVETMNKLVEGFEEMSGAVLPSPVEDAYIDALHTNYMV